MKQLLKTISILLFSIAACAQTTEPIDRNYYDLPVKIPVFLSGNFAELRPNHFHGGIDIKTQGRTGIPIYAAADGYVSRINISASGYGNALYINHPNGTTTVYGHLDRFSKPIEDFIRNIQYQKEQFAVDQTVEPGILPVTRGEEIAKSGNSGSSAGPHLHYEIRKTKEEIQLNPLLFNIPLTDKIKPTIQSLMVYPASAGATVNGKQTTQRFEVLLSGNTYQLKTAQVISVSGKIGFGLQSIDRHDGSANKCGIYSLNLSIDEETIHAFKLDELAISQTKYINSFIDYALAVRTGLRLYRSWREPGNQLEVYTTETTGLYDATDGQKHRVKYELSDIYGNTSSLEFFIQATDKTIATEEPKGELMKYNRDNKLKNDDLVFTIPEGALYSDMYFEYEKKPTVQKFYGPTFQLHTTQVPLHFACNLKIKASHLPEELRNKAMLAQIDPLSGKINSATGKYEHGWIEGNVRTLGHYTLAVDTIPPKIVSLIFGENKTLKDPNKLQLKINDNLSGIEKYRGTIDDKWVLFEYDLKNNLLSYTFDKSRFTFNKNHTLILEVSDYKGNTSTYKTNFWK